MVHLQVGALPISKCGEVFLSLERGLHSFCSMLDWLCGSENNVNFKFVCLCVRVCVFFVWPIVSI